MGTRLSDLIDRRMPRLNSEICSGLTARQSHDVEAYINAVWRSAATSFPPGLRYTGYKRCTPMEQYREITRPPKPRHSFDLSKSDVYLVKYMFTFNDIELRPRHIFLPFINDGNFYMINGTRYTVSPVLSGNVFNIENDKVYMPTPRSKMTFAGIGHSIMKNNAMIHGIVVHSGLYNLKATERSKLPCTLIHYLLSDIGLEGVLERYFNTTCRVGNAGLESLIGGEEYTVYGASGIKPRGVFSTTDIRIALPSKAVNKTIDAVMCGVFFILDQFPEVLEPKDALDPNAWLTLLPRFIFKSDQLSQKRYTETVNHLDSVRLSMDAMTQQALKGIGVECKDIFDLFVYFIANFQDIVMHHDVGSMYGMRLTTVEYLCYLIVHNIFILSYELKKLSGARLNPEKITHTMDSRLKKDRVFVVKGRGELSSSTIATDCKPLGATSSMVSQTNAQTAGKRNKGRAAPTAGMLLHASQVEICTVLMGSKSEPTSRSRINPFLQFDRGYLTAKREDLKPCIENLRDLISRE